MTSPRCSCRVITRHARLPFADLEIFITAHHGIDDEVLKGNTHRVLNVGWRQTARRIARLTGFEPAEVHRWMAHDLPYFKADRAAAGLAVNANEIWPGFAELEPYVRELRLCSSPDSSGAKANQSTSTSTTEQTRTCSCRAASSTRPPTTP